MSISQVPGPPGSMSIRNLVHITQGHSGWAAVPARTLLPITQSLSMQRGPGTSSLSNHQTPGPHPAPSTQHKPFTVSANGRKHDALWAATVPA